MPLSLEIAIIVENIILFFKTVFGWFVQLNHYVNGNFGFFAQVALDLAIMYFLFLLFTKMVKVAFDMLKFVVLPALLLTGIISFLLPYTFFHLLPFCTGTMIIINLLRT
ncbi:MAG: hypothetical protein AMJ90_07835 [candidate division Zixibacteria bacterium SM23_73_2]|nr:MAG: hypothetical protein AMJ90_07835 [candidate division Zixibacteria bacterium SM23_73_2]